MQKVRPKQFFLALSVIEEPIPKFPYVMVKLLIHGSCTKYVTVTPLKLVTEFKVQTTD
jgi:hypothetical protein